MKTFEEYWKKVPSGCPTERFIAKHAFDARDAEIKALVVAGRYYMKICPRFLLDGLEHEEHSATLAAYEGKEADDGPRRP